MDNRNSKVRQMPDRSRGNGSPRGAYTRSEKVRARVKNSIRYFDYSLVSNSLSPTNSTCAGARPVCSQ